MITVATYNIHKAHSMARGCRLNVLKEAISEINVDIVFLQEVQDINIKRHNDSFGHEVSSQTSELQGEQYPYAAYGANAFYEHGHHGNAILSKYPIKTWQNIDVSDHKLEQRGVLHAIVEHPKYGEIHAICTHFGLFKVSRVRQAKALVEHIRHSILDNMPLVIAGDFNDWNLHVHHILTGELALEDAIETMQQQTRKKDIAKKAPLGRTFPSFIPWFKLDRLYVRGFQIAEAHVKSGLKWHARSDHMPIQARLTIKPQERG
ncbi:MAG: endonuclease/exonuclease/phosphatase family protein [Sulfurovaceae bacterium]